MTAQGIGASVKRREDFRFIKGVGKYKIGRAHV